MVRFHPSGRSTLVIVSIFVVASLVPLVMGLSPKWVWSLLSLAAIIIAVFCWQFFRYPRRVLAGAQQGEIYAPADGVVVVIEHVDEKKHFQERRTQLSIFMSPLNVHVNWTPCSGEVLSAGVIDGDYLFARNPKSSELNEHSEILIQHGSDVIYCKQIAGVMARRIICDTQQGDELAYGDEIGFIKFGSRVDLLLPLDYEILVDLGQVTKGNQTLVARKRG